MKIKLKLVPPIIRDSARSVITARACRIVDSNGIDVTEDVLQEIGNNAAQALVSIDEDND